MRCPEAADVRHDATECDECRDLEYRAKFMEALDRDLARSNERPRTAADLLRRAADLLDERGRDYDQPDGERSMAKTCGAFFIITGKDLDEEEGWLFMQLLKDVRQWSREGWHRDSAEDCIAYAALKAEAGER